MMGVYLGEKVQYNESLSVQYLNNKSLRLSSWVWGFVNSMYSFKGEKPMQVNYVGYADSITFENQVKYYG